MQTDITRRGLVTTAAAATAAIAAAGLLQASQAKAAEAKGQSVELHRGYSAPEDGSSFAQVVVAVDGDGKIVAANIDEYAFVDSSVDDITSVPNSKASFGENYAEGKTLISKQENNEYYSKLMADYAKATMGWYEGITVITDFVVGKTAAELEGVDTVSGCTLTSAADYVAAIATVAQDDSIVAKGEGDLSGAALGNYNGAAHGTKAFTNAVSLVSGGSIVATSIDEFQFLSSDTDGLVPVPNSDASFGENYAEGYKLASKMQNNEYYSKLMADHAGATQAWEASVSAIEGNLVGTNIDVVSGATLVDGVDYALVAIKAGSKAESK